jgi:hypothetical protein
MAILRARAGRPAGSPIAALRERAGSAAGCSRDELVPVRGGFDRALAGRKWLDAVHPALSYPAIYLTPRSCRKDGDAGIPRGRERAAVSSESRMTVVAALLPDPNGRAGRDVAEIRRPAGSTAFPAWRPGEGASMPSIWNEVTREAASLPLSVGTFKKMGTSRATSAHYLAPRVAATRQDPLLSGQRPLRPSKWRP